jgi:hypothetical protein
MREAAEGHRLDGVVEAGLGHQRRLHPFRDIKFSTSVITFTSFSIDNRQKRTGLQTQEFLCQAKIACPVNRIARSHPFPERPS